MDTTMHETIRGLMPGLQADLERLVKVPSCAFPGFDQRYVQESADLTAGLFRDAGMHDVRILPVPGGSPAVYGHIPGPEGTPTVLLYAHHDVQPPGPEDQWESPPYEPTVRDGRLFGRGTSDDKCGIVMHLAALRAFGGKPPVGIKIIIEGEEEATAEHLPWLIGEHVDLLRADAVVVADSGSWRTGVPALTTSIRGVVATNVEVRVLDQSLHSGGYGGPIPDAITALARMIASLHDDAGNVAVDGLLRRHGFAAADHDEATFREEAGVRPSVQLIGDGTLADRLWFGPSISVIGIDAPSIQETSFQIVPVARACVTMRISPGEDAHEALQKLTDHLRAAAPWGVEVSFEGDERAIGHETATSGVIFDAAMRSLADAWGAPPKQMGMGGSVPLVPVLVEALPDAVVLMTGPGDQHSNDHSINESVDLQELERACVAEALFLAYLAETAVGA